MSEEYRGIYEWDASPEPKPAEVEARQSRRSNVWGDVSWSGGDTEWHLG